MQAISRERLERVARMYKSNKDASAALGMALGSFSRACKRHGIETPHMKKRAQRTGRKA